MFALVSLSAWSQGAKGANIVILLRLAGDSRALPPLESCLNSKLRKMPDIEVATAPIDGVRFIVDVIAGRGADNGISASFVVAETFPIAEFRPRIWFLWRHRKHVMRSADEEKAVCEAPAKGWSNSTSEYTEPWLGAISVS